MSVVVVVVAAAAAATTAAPTVAIAAALDVFAVHPCQAGPFHEEPRSEIGSGGESCAKEQPKKVDQTVPLAAHHEHVTKAPAQHMLSVRLQTLFVHAVACFLLILRLMLVGCWLALSLPARQASGRSEGGAQYLCGGPGVYQIDHGAEEVPQRGAHACVCVSVQPRS